MRTDVVPPVSRRRRLTFSLRSFLVAIVLLAIVLAYFGNVLVEVRQKRAIRKEIMALGAEAYFDHECIGGDERGEKNWQH